MPFVVLGMKRSAVRTYAFRYHKVHRSSDIPAYRWQIGRLTLHGDELCLSDTIGGIAQIGRKMEEKSLSFLPMTTYSNGNRVAGIISVFGC